MNARLPRIAAALVLVAACHADPLAPNVRRGQSATTPSQSSDAPNFLNAAAGAPAIANPVVSFYAVKGEDRTATMVYHAAPGATDSAVFLSLRIRAKSLLARPDGTPIADGDSVLITVSLVDAQHLIVDCQPSGLRFSSSQEPRLKMSFLETDADVNGDGVVDAQDAALTRTFSVWRRESSAEPWFSVASNVAVGAHEVEAEISGFTSYAIAY